MVNTNAIKARMKGQRVTIKDLSEALRISEDEIERLISGEEDLDTDQAEEIQRVLQIPDIRFSFYFF
ncbi:helix-turn-helix transcriptional regulator [bacterium]|nr:helix-turn-helix transcriptional regulator [bacterium]